MLNINATLFIQIANFLVLLILLNFILYRPIRRILRQRDEEIDALQGSIRDYKRRVEGSEKGIEESQIQARKEGFAEKESLKGSGQEEERKILGDAGSSVEEKIGKAKKELEDNMEQVRKALEGEIANFSGELAEKILGRSVQ